MPNPRFQVAIGTVDGINTTFQTSAEYSPGSLAVFRNGVLLEKSLDNGWTEVGDNLTFNMKIAPLTLDIIQCFYLDTEPSYEVVEEISGTLDDIDYLEGTVQDTTAIAGELEDIESLDSTLVEVVDIAGTVEDVESLHGTLEECP